MSGHGRVFYRGPSLLTGDPIVGVFTGLGGESKNPKTGPMAQGWILRSDRPPMEAKRQNVDDAICGNCSLRGWDGKNSGCYVSPGLAPNQVYKSLASYPVASRRDLPRLLRGLSARFGAYGDPAAIPFPIWSALARGSSGWIGYTHQWRTCDPQFKRLLMASVDSDDEFYAAHAAGWRTFRIRMPGDPLLRLEGVPLEFACPASDEMSHRTTCQSCQLCRGTASPARSVAIQAHGKPSSLSAFGIHVPMFGRRA